MPKGPLHQSRAKSHLAWLIPNTRLSLKEQTDGQCVVWKDNEVQASYAGQSWEEVMRQAVMEAWKNGK